MSGTVIAGGVRTGWRRVMGASVRITCGERAIPIACGKAALAIRALRMQAANAHARYAAGLISREERERRLHGFGEKIAAHERTLARYRSVA